jgi:energy-coupling factor transporter ATP-binding protein EcfA2
MSPTATPEDTAQQTAIELIDLRFAYRQSAVPVLDGISLTVARGSFVAVLGANSSGKSTLCHALSGFIPHFYQGDLQGRVRIVGLDTALAPLTELVQVASLVFQNPANQISGAKFTVREEIAFGLENLGVPRAEMTQRVTEVVRQVGIADLADRSPFALSGGQQQLLALAAMLVLRPQIFVLDEATSALDSTASRRVFELLRQLSRSGMTVVLAERKLEEIARYCDRVLILDQGRIILDGPPRQVLASQELEKCHVGRTRYSRVAERALAFGGWPQDRSLPVGLTEAVAGFLHFRSER